MKRRVLFTVMGGALAAALGGGAWVFAQGAAPNVAGEVTKVDKAAGRIEIRHGEIKNLDMPPMRMVFRVRELKMLEGLAAGDKVRFAAEKIDGQFTVVAIVKAP